MFPMYNLSDSKILRYLYERQADVKYDIDRNSERIRGLEQELEEVNLAIRILEERNSL